MATQVTDYAAHILGVLLELPKRLHRSLIGAADLVGDASHAISRYDQLRHMSDAQLRDLGIDRNGVPRRLFEELYEDKG